MQPYMNPYYFQNNPAFQQQYGQINPYPDRLAQLQAQQQQLNQSQYSQQMPIQPMGLSGEVVDSIDVVKAKNVDMSGNVTYYPKADLSEIFTKQLMPDGTSRIVTYKAIPSDKPQDQVQQPVISLETLDAMFAQLKQDLLQEIAQIKEAIPQSSQQQENGRQQKGGWQK